MKLLLLAMASGALLVPGSARDECDLKKVVDAFHCKKDALTLLKKDLVSAKRYYECHDCSVWTFQRGNCDHCKKPLEAKTSGKGVCKTCLRTPEPRQVCQKTYYECPSCGSAAAKAGKCESCDERRKRATSRELVEYSCDGGCGAVSTTPASCVDSECDAYERPLARRCTQSGTPPHGRF